LQGAVESMTGRNQSRPAFTACWTAVTFAAAGLALMLAVPYANAKSSCQQTVLYEATLVVIALGPCVAALISFVQRDRLVGRETILPLVFAVGGATLLTCALGLLYLTSGKCH
jgi:hypothetical protein